MNYKSGDTIAAIATPAGNGGIGIIRISGPKAICIAKKITSAKLIPRYAQFTEFKNKDGLTVDSGILIYFKAPHSFTGEDIIELQAHGGPALLDTLLNTCCHFGARFASPGEFSLRAFINDKLDLAQAESLPDLIGASTERAVISAANSLQGEFSERVKELAKQILELRIMVEASLDFPEEEIDFLEDLSICKRVANLVEKIELLRALAQEGKLLSEGATFVIAGEPNVGKSSLLNALTYTNRAIVSDIPGTTRDTISEEIQLDGIPINIVDTAGLRDTDDSIEQEGVTRTITAASKADRVLLVFDVSKIPNLDDLDLNLLLAQFRDIPEEVGKTIIFNKTDLSDHPSREHQKNGQSFYTLSAKTGEGISDLKRHLKNSLIPESDAKNNPITARQRHISALESCINTLKKAAASFEVTRAGELLAEDLRLCADDLNKITGKNCDEELLNQIFSRFCIGK